MKKKKDFFGSKIGKKFENNVQKLTNLKEKKGLFGPKNKLGLSLGKKLGKKLSIKPKIDQFSKKKKDFSGQKKQAGAELKGKKKIFWVQNWGKFGE